MAEIPKERLERAKAAIEAAEAAKPQPAMTDELRADVAQRREAMLAGQENDYKRPRAEAKEADEQTAESAQQASDAMNDLAAAGQSQRIGEINASKIQGTITTAQLAAKDESDGSTDSGTDSPRPSPRNRK